MAQERDITCVDRQSGEFINQLPVMVERTGETRRTNSFGGVDVEATASDTLLIAKGDQRYRTTRVEITGTRQEVEVPRKTQTVNF